MATTPDGPSSSPDPEMVRLFAEMGPSNPDMPACTPEEISQRLRAAAAPPPRQAHALINAVAGLESARLMPPAPWAVHGTGFHITPVEDPRLGLLMRAAVEFCRPVDGGQMVMRYTADIRPLHRPNEIALHLDRGLTSAQREANVLVDEVFPVSSPLADADLFSGARVADAAVAAIMSDLASLAP